MVLFTYLYLWSSSDEPSSVCNSGQRPPHILCSHPWPVNPGGHPHSPVMWLQGSPGAQSQLEAQSFPNEPGRQAAGSTKRGVSAGATDVIRAATTRAVELLKYSREGYCWSLRGKQDFNFLRTQLLASQLGGLSTRRLLKSQHLSLDSPCPEKRPGASHPLFPIPQCRV